MMKEDKGELKAHKPQAGKTQPQRQKHQENLFSKNIIAAAHIGRLRCQDVLEQTAAAELSEKTAQALEPRGL